MAVSVNSCIYNYHDKLEIVLVAGPAASNSAGSTDAHLFYPLLF